MCDDYLYSRPARVSRRIIISRVWVCVYTSVRGSAIKRQRGRERNNLRVFDNVTRELEVKPAGSVSFSNDPGTRERVCKCMRNREREGESVYVRVYMHDVCSLV